MTCVAIIGAGMMGSGVAARLHDCGCRVLTNLDSRSDASRERAAKAGMEDVPPSAFGEADMILSIVPPAQARAVVEWLAPLFQNGKAPLFCDANALSPETKKELAARVAELGGTMVDGSIIGGAPKEGYDGPRLYVCGDNAETILRLNDHGIDTRLLSGPLGAAAALKMCYGGINKGIIGLITAMLLASQRHGAAEDLRKELGISQQDLLEKSRRVVPSMYPRAYRWDAEMHEISSFLAPDDKAAAILWQGLGEFYTDRAKAYEAGLELDELVKLLS